MKSTFIYLCLSLLCFTGGYAQGQDSAWIIRSVFPSLGNEGIEFPNNPPQQYGLNMTYTVGETFTLTSTSLLGSLTFTQGFQQPDDPKDFINSIDDLRVKLEYHIYPNPTTGPITIVLTSEEPLILQIALYDLLGQETPIPRQEVRMMGRFSTQMDLSNLADGVYLLAIHNEKKRVIRTFRIEKYY